MIRRPPRSTRTDTLFPYTTLFRSWPLTLTIVLLFGPKVLSVLWLLIDDSRRKALGGLDGILNSIAIEIPLSILVAPLNMLTQTMAIIDIIRGRRSEERRVGKECVSTCRSRWSPYH